MVSDMMEGSDAVARAAALCRLKVVAAYPITPSTHIPEKLSEYQKEYGFEFVPVESEFSAISAIIGASATGARVFTATSSQGLALMHEALHNAAGMRLPIVMVVANRALSAPLNIWNDWQDSLSQRDTGWIQLYCKNNQEAADTTIQAFAIAEKASLPVMVCFEGYYLTHEVSPVDLPTQHEVDAFLPANNRKKVLDVENPLTLGAFAGPAHYQEIKQQQQNDLLDSLKTICDTANEFEKRFGRKQFPLIEEYRSEDAGTVFFTMGSLAENIEVAVDELRAKGEAVGLVRLKTFRPFPNAEIARALKGKKRVIVLEKDYSYGNEGVLATELKATLHDYCVEAIVSPHVLGLGGRDVPLDDAKKIYYADDGSRK